MGVKEVFVCAGGSGLAGNQLENKLEDKVLNIILIYPNFISIIHPLYDLWQGPSTM